jgi:putative membrane protein
MQPTLFPLLTKTKPVPLFIVRKAGKKEEIMLIVTILATIVGIEHLGIMLLEMFGQPEMQSKSFNVPLELTKVHDVRVLFGNQGIYNGMLGLTILIVTYGLSGAAQIMMMKVMLAFVIVVAVYGTFTATKKIILMQGLPAILAIIAVFMGI